MSIVSLFLVVAVPLVAAALIAGLSSRASSAGSLAVRASSLALAGAAWSFVTTAMGAPPSWVLSTGGTVAIGFGANRATATIALLTTAVSLVVHSFAARALDGDPRAPRFFALSCLLTSATASVALSATGIGVAVAWVATSISLVALLRHQDEWHKARRAARLTALNFALGDAALVGAIALAGPVLTGMDAVDLHATAARLSMHTISIAGLVEVNRLDMVASLLVLAGICRSGLIPAHRWLASTLAAPTPVSALLHAGVINGVGVLLIRLSPVVGTSRVAMSIAFAAGAATAIGGTAVMLTRGDVKGTLAWSTAGQMGFMTVQIAVGAFGAALFHLVGHAMYKAALFLGAGGSVTAAQAHRHLPVTRPGVGYTTRIGVAALLPAVGLIGALAVTGASGSPASKVLIAFFGWLTGFRLVAGWLRSAPRTATAAVGTAVAGVGWPFAYVVAVTTFERFVSESAPMSAPAAVGARWLVATIVTVAIIAMSLRRSPSAARRQWRRRVYAMVAGLGVPPPARRRSLRSRLRRSMFGGARRAAAAIASREPAQRSAGP